MEDKELDASTKLGKVKKLAKMKDAMPMVCATQYLSSTAMLKAIFKVQAEAGWPTERACQLFDNLKQKFNHNNKLLRVQMIVRKSPVRRYIMFQN